MNTMVLDNNSPQDRIIYLSGDVTDSNISDVCKKILDINDIDRKGINTLVKYEVLPIELHVQSFGGSIPDMWALIDIIESSTTPIVTYCSGYCMSAASLIFLAGHIRCMYKHSVIMFHQMSNVVYGKYKDVKLEQNELDRLHRQMIKYIKKHTKLDKDFFRRFDKMKEDIHFTPKQAVKFGICDEVVSKSGLRKKLKKQLEQEDGCECE